jgi:outer membrane protein insertion porin family
MRATILLVVVLLPVALFPSGAAAAVDEALFEPFEGQTIAEITISGNDLTKDHIVTREFELGPGNVFSLEALRADVRRLYNLGIFTSVTVTPYETEGGLGLQYTLREFPGLIPYITASYSELNGWSVGPAVSATNLFGRNIDVSAFMLFGGRRAYSLKVGAPWIADERVSLDVVARRITRDNDYYGFEETSDEFTPSIGRPLGENGRARLMLSYFGVESNEDGHTLSGDNRDNMFRVGTAVGYDSRDDYRNPHEGWQLDLQVMKTGGALGGDGNFWTTAGDVRRYQPLGERHTLAVGALTTLQTGTVGEDIPEYMQFNLGGVNSIRGHRPDGLAMTLYGKNQLLTTVEYRFLASDIREYEVFGWPVGVGLQLALFGDAGVAWNDDSDFSWGRKETGYGVGVRLLVPVVDMIRMDVGFNSDGEATFHFAIDQKFEAQRKRLR